MTMIAGLGAGLLYSVYVVVLVAVKGPQVLEVYDTTLPTVVGIYFAGGLLGGVIVGLLLPLGRCWFGAMLVGALAAQPVFAMVGMAMYPPSEWATELPLMLLVLAAPMGSAVGLKFWYDYRRKGHI